MLQWLYHMEDVELRAMDAMGAMDAMDAMEGIPYISWVVLRLPASCYFIYAFSSFPFCYIFMRLASFYWKDMVGG